MFQFKHLKVSPVNLVTDFEMEKNIIVIFLISYLKIF